MISPATIIRLREAVDLQALAADYVSLRRSGADLVCTCPLHKEKTASCHVHESYFKCFGCQAGGDAIKWLRLVGGLSFLDACRALSDLTGIQIDSKPISRVRTQYEKEERELCKWWWARRHTILRAELDSVMAIYMAESDEIELCWLESVMSDIGRRIRWHPSSAMRTDIYGVDLHFLRQVTAYDRWLWREDQAWDKRLERAWVDSTSDAAPLTGRDSN